LPQLPLRHVQESMLLQWGNGMLGAGARETGLAIGMPPGERQEAFTGAAAMLRMITGDTVKTQVTGPVTLAAALRAGGVTGPHLIGSVTEQLETRIDEHLAWIRSESDVSSVILVIDEPALAALGSTDELPGEAAKALIDLVDGFEVDIGLHCCDDTDWGGIAELGFDWLSWDVATLSGGFYRGLDRIAAALGAGGRVMWGIVPTTTAPLPSTNVLLDRYGTAVANLVVAGAPFEALMAEAMFTPACGMAGLSVSDAEAVADALRLVVEEVESGW
jgi:methionine synthase II (cobalamin-independent)